MSETAIFSGSAHPELAKDICDQLERFPCAVNREGFPNQ